MKRRMPRVVPAVLMAAAAAFPAHAADWGQLATISSTLGVNANRLCVGEGLRSDIGCPAYAPYVSATSGYLGIGTSTPIEALQVNGKVIVGSGFGGATRAAGISLNSADGYNTIGFGAPGSWFAGLYANSINQSLNITDATSSWPGMSRVTFLRTGNVGISTSNPNAKLEVNGDISATNLRLSGNLYVSGSQTFDGVTFANGGVSATGIVTATSFSGDGSRLTGLAAGDRIISGTSNVTVAQDGSVTITTAGGQRLVIGNAGANRFDGRLDINHSTLGGNALNVYTAQAGRMVSFQSNGVTNGQSLFGITQGNALTGNATVEAIRATLNTDRRGDIAIYQAGEGSARFNALALSTGDAQSSYGVNGGQYWSVGLDQSAASAFKISADDDLGTNDRLIVLPVGNVGIGMATPTAALQVSGSFTVSTSAQTTTPSLYVGTNGNMGVGTSSPSAPLEVQSNSGNTEGVRIARNGVPTQYLSLHEGGGATHTIEGYGQKGIKIINRSSTGDSYAAIGFFVSTSTLAMEIAPNGKVGIGTTLMNDGIGRPSSTLHVAGTARITSWTAIAANVTPTTELDVYGTISATNILVNGSPITATADRITSGTTSAIAYNGGSITFATAGSNRVVFGSNGNVGVGTTSPLGLFDARSSTGQFLLGNSSAPSIGQTAMLLLAPSNGFLNTTYWNRAPAIAGVQEDGTNYSGLAFYTYIGGNQVEKVRIDKNGNVGIGTSAPNSGIHIARAITSAGTSPLATFENTASGSADQVRLSLIRGFDTGTGTNRGAVVFASSGIAGWADYENRALTFWTSASSVTSEKMRIGANGNVGIGTTSPGKTLSVSGTAEIVSRTLVGGTGTPSATFQVSGSLLLAGNDNIPCTASVLGLVRRNPTTGRLQACR